jgi:hypothetical protein
VLLPEGLLKEKEIPAILVRVSAKTKAKKNKQKSKDAINGKNRLF